ncbi:hypothetical protein EVAR_86527_1 [Eumeta japonica]|uniref:Uncharacterized protein n=1 Tax=Eumeta variegata TaxID=151549 RepID=A0A4C1VNZ5_EUMVA|nr:hypothetical protein EVAR_86527_1 [Eumeta japonica]
MGSLFFPSSPRTAARSSVGGLLWEPTPDRICASLFPPSPIRPLLSAAKDRRRRQRRGGRAGHSLSRGHINAFGLGDFYDSSIRKFYLMPEYGPNRSQRVTAAD